MKYKVLIVEDNDDINQLIYNLIKDEYDAVQAFSGTEALRIWNDRDTQPIDIILLDLMLPGKSGEEIISEIRKTSSVPIIVITAKGDTSRADDICRDDDAFIFDHFTDAARFAGKRDIAPLIEQNFLNAKDEQGYRK